MEMLYVFFIIPLCTSIIRGLNGFAGQIAAINGDYILFLFIVQEQKRMAPKVARVCCHRRLAVRKVQVHSSSLPQFCNPSCVTRSRWRTALRASHFATYCIYLIYFGYYHCYGQYSRYSISYGPIVFSLKCFDLPSIYFY